MLKLVYAAAGAAVALGIAATAHAQPEGKQDYTKSIHKRDHARVNAAELPAQIGNERWVVLLCRFSDSPTPVPHAAADYDSAFNTHAKSHKNYFKEASYGQLNLTFTIKNWKATGPRSNFPGDYNSNGDTFLLQLYDACTAAHDATTNFAAFDGIAMFFDDREKRLSDGKACGFGDTCTTDRGLGTNYGMFSVDSKVLDGANGFRAIWMANTSSAHNEVTAHEMHHAYGAPHSGAGTDDVNDTECEFNNVDSCGHPWDLMSSAWFSLPTDTHTLAATKVFYHKWIAPPRRCNVVKDTPAAGTVFELERLAKARDNDRCLAITIRHSVYSDHFGTDVIWYVVEARFPIGFDADSDPSFGGGGVPGPAVIISRVCLGPSLNCSITSMGQPVVLGRDVSPADGQIDEGSAEWQAGETFVNFDGKIKVQVVSKGAGFYTVRVTRKESGGL
jgi:M6 family metalloprotease-like protein